jgi:SAM-dependent methyltransferase
MSRLDGSNAPKDDDGKERPSAAELLGGRGKRRRIAIRVPDDATPPPPPIKRSQPPPAMPASQPPPVAEAKETKQEPEKSPSEPAPKAASEPALRPPSEPPRPASVPPRPASEPAPRPAEMASVRITPTRMIGVGAPAALAPPSGSVPPQPIATRPAGDAPPSTTPAQDLVSNDAGSVPSIVAAATSTASTSPSQRPSQRPSQPPPRPSSPSTRLSTPYPMPVSFKPPGLPTPESIAAREVVIKPVPVPAGALVSQPIDPISQQQPPSTEPSPTPPPAQQPRAPTVPNLDRAVKEALDLLDREDFETTAIDVAVVVHDQDEETQPRLPAVAGDGPTSEESLDDSVVEEVEPQVPTSGKVKVAPTPPPRKATGSGQAVVAAKGPAASGDLVQTLPSARVTESQPSSAPATPHAPTQPEGAAPAAALKTPGPSPLPATSPDATAEIVKKKKRQWFEELFNDDFARTMPRVPAAHLDREVGFIDDSLGCEKGATILDLGCGPGEHAVRLSKRGYEVIGIDLSLAMLARAADEAAALDTRINFVQGDMRELTFEESFDGVYCWGTTFGYFDEQKNAEVIGKVHRALRRGGRILLDVVNRDYVMPRQPSMAWFEGEGCVCMDEMYVNAITSRLHVKRTMMMEDGRQREIDYSIRIYSLHELGKLLHESGFRVVEASGDTSTAGVYFGAESPRIIILAEKR